MPTVNDITAIIENYAKPEYAFEWDNCGLLAGNRNNSVNKIMVSLDITKQVVSEAIDKKCDMILSHHPLVFKPVKNLNVDTYEGEILSMLYKNDISLYCAHTSLDICRNGVNDSLCEALLLKDVAVPKEINVSGENVSCSRKGVLPKILNKSRLIDYVKDKLGATQLSYYLADKEYKTVGVCSGAGEEYAFLLDDVDVFLTGEVKYHTALELKRKNISFISAGHYYTEIQVVDKVIATLQKNFNMLKYNVEVIKSETNTNPFEN